MAVCGLWRGKGKAEIYILQDFVQHASAETELFASIAVASQSGFLFLFLAMLPQCCRLTVPNRGQCRRLCGSLGCHKSNQKNTKEKHRCCPRRRCSRSLERFTRGQQHFICLFPKCSPSHLADARKLLATNWGCQLTCLASIKCFLCR